jgi:Undecaprenyl-phosphate glucose phosphotransferase
MNAVLPPATLDDATLTDTFPGDPRDRRGPFRPEKLVSARERRSGDMFVRLFRGIDFLALVFLAVTCARAVAPHGFFTSPLGNILPFIATTLGLYWALYVCGLYRFGRNARVSLHLVKLALIFGAGYLLADFLADFSVNDYAVTAAVRFWIGVSLAYFMLQHLLWWRLVERWRRQGKLTPSIVIVGATKYAEKLIEAAIAERHVNILGIFDDRMARNPHAVAGVPVLGDVQSLLGHKITPYVDQIVVALDTSAKARVKTIIEKLRSLPNEVSLFVDMDNDSAAKAAWARVADIPLARVSGISEDDRKAMLKRGEDLIIGCLALLIFAPVMLIIALMIKLDSPGPIFFRQRRHGFNNESIMVWKFRSMYTHLTDHTAQQQVTKGDPRVTPIGRFIRKTSIDELPQLFNVLKGEMSLVGPRPHAIGMKTGPDESARLVAEYAWRHRMKPGVTGWAAINGSRGPLDNADDVRRRIGLDVEYIERHSIWFDLYIMTMTIPCLLGDAKTVR